MNRRAIGTEFEKEAIPILEKEFDKVYWLSEKRQSVFDFKCIKDGKEYFGDAKVSNHWTKATIRKSQKGADFVIAKLKGEIKLIMRGNFKDNVVVGKSNGTIIMDVKVSDLKWLKTIKKRLELSSVHAALSKVRQIFKNLKLENEL